MTSTRLMYTCDRCKKNCGTIRLTEGKMWVCNRCYWNKDGKTIDEIDTKKKK